METVTSRDGTVLAFERSGSGPPLILVVGAFNDRATGAPLADVLASHFTVLNYDRRGRGASGDGVAYAIEREIEDLDALVTAAGGRAYAFGYSSGAILCLRAAALGVTLPRLALYEPPPTGARAAAIAPQLSALIGAGLRGDAVELFQREAVGIPAEVVIRLRNAPFRPALEAMAHTLFYDSTLLEALPAGLAASVDAPVLVLDGENSPPVMRESARGLAAALGHGRYRTLEGQGHDLVPAVLAPVLRDFFMEA